jgi:cytoskeletal protein CcmA (bactofilin family)
MTRRVALAVYLIVWAVAPGWATEFRAGKTVSIEPNEVIDDDLFAAGSSVLIAGRVTGDVFAAGDSVRVTGPIGGSVMAAGRDVRVTGNVDGSVRAAGQSVSLTGSVGRNIAAAGQALLLADTTRVARDLHAAGGTLNVDGRIGRRAAIAAETASIRGDIGDELYFEGGTLSLGPAARIGGDLVHRSRARPEVATGAVISGQTTALPPRQRPERENEGRSAFPVIFALMTLVFGLVGIAAAPRIFVAGADAVGNRPWWNLLLGFLTLFVGPAFVAVVMLTVIGLPIGLLMLVLWIAALAFSCVPVATSVGRWLVERIKRGPVSPYLGLIVGLILLALLTQIPVLRWLISAAVLLVGLGVYVRAAKGLLADMRKTPA